MSTCAYCGQSNGVHVWAGSGGCPGAACERERDQAAATVIRSRDLIIDLLEYKLAVLTQLARRSADALSALDSETSRQLIAELRGAAEDR